MRQFLAASSLAILLAASSQQQASAWCSFNFGIGFNFGIACGHGGPQCPPACRYDLCSPGYGGVGGPVYAGYVNNGFGGGYGGGYGYGAGYGAAPAGNFVAPQPTPVGTHSMAPAGSFYPASYQPMSYYPMSYYPMSYPVYGYYGQ